MASLVLGGNENKIVTLFEAKRYEKMAGGQYAQAATVSFRLGEVHTKIGKLFSRSRERVSAYAYIYGTRALFTLCGNRCGVNTAHI